jgi:L-methionine (R)-S-oxide reductase
MSHRYLIKEFQGCAQSGDAKSLMQHISERIHAHIPRYNWVGFYLLDPKNHDALVLGPHTGSFTPKTIIPLGQGLCGAAFSSGRVLVVDNVAEDARYVAASDIVKAHISVPLVIGIQPLGVFSVESYFLAAFQPAVEREFVQTCAQIVVTCAEHPENLRFDGNAPIPAPSNFYQLSQRRNLSRIPFLSLF